MNLGAEYQPEPHVLYLDNHLLVLSKPAGLATHEDGVHWQTLRLWAENYLAKKLNKPGRAFVVPVHRLDRLTSGVVLFAKTDKALSRMMEAFRERKVEKRYRVRVEGVLKDFQGRFEDGLIRKESKSFVVDQNRPGAQFASLSYQKIKTQKNESECFVDLETGRHHQIRVQFASRGHPVIGDQKYGSAFDLGEKIMLHHERLVVPHPITGEKMSFEAPLPSFWL
jgi:23S rRNA pseudouridine1911/1915/1917 synthase